MPSLAQDLLGQPARRPLASVVPPPPRLERVQVLGPVAGRVKLLVRLRDSRTIRVRELWLRRAGHRWRVEAPGG